MSLRTAFIRFKSISMSKARYRKPQSLKTAAAHNLREVDPKSYADDLYDPKMSIHNVILRGPRVSADIVSLADSQATKLSATPTKPRKDYCQAIECVVSLHRSCDIDRLSYFRDSVEWLEIALGLPVLSAIIHNDQSSPHMHVLLNPIQPGRRVGSTPIGQPRLPILRTLFRDQVASRYGLTMYGLNPPKSISGLIRALDMEVLKGIRPGIEDDGLMFSLVELAAKSNPGSVLALLRPPLAPLQAAIDRGGRRSTDLREFLSELFPVYRVQFGSRPVLSDAA